MACYISIYSIGTEVLKTARKIRYIICICKLDEVKGQRPLFWVNAKSETGPQKLTHMQYYLLKFFYPDMLYGHRSTN